MAKKLCEMCAGKKVVMFMPGGKTRVYAGHEKAMQSQLDKLDAGKLEKRPCPECVKHQKKKLYQEPKKKK